LLKTLINLEKKEKRKKINKKFLYYYFNSFFLKKNKIFVFKKYLLVSSIFISKHAYIYNGCIYRKLFITQFVKLLNFGSFVFTRKPFKYLLKKKKR
jgi:ribosomal protein S19